MEKTYNWDKLTITRSERIRPRPIRGLTFTRIRAHGQRERQDKYSEVCDCNRLYVILFLLFGQERKIGDDLVNVGGGINLDGCEGSGVSGSAGVFFLIFLFSNVF